METDARKRWRLEWRLWRMCRNSWGSAKGAYKFDALITLAELHPALGRLGWGIPDPLTRVLPLRLHSYRVCKREERRRLGKPQQTTPTPPDVH